MIRIYTAMTLQIFFATFILLIVASGSDGIRFDCAIRGMCNGLAMYGKQYTCYRYGALMSYPRDCVTYRCERRGRMYLPSIYKIDCKSGGRCRQNGETWITRGRYGCMKYTCRVMGNRRNVHGVATSCYG